MAVPPSERVFWEQRRASARQMRPPTIFSDFPPPYQTQELQGTPAGLGPLISPYATVREVRMSKNPAAPLVVHMQDLHGSLEAQENMARAMSSLVNHQGVTLVGLEGAEGPFSLDDFRRYPEQVRQKVAQHFLKKNLIGAGEFVALTSSRPVTLWGLEDRPLYFRNVAAAKESLLNRARVETFLGPLDNALAEQKARVYSNDLRSFDQAFEEYEKGVLPLGGYIKALLRFQPETADSPTFANVRRLLSALNAEEALDFAAVERDRMKVLKILTDRMSRPTMEAFMRANVEFRMVRQTHDTFETALKKLCADHNVPLSPFPHLKAYLRYTGLAGQLQREGLLNELKILERTTQRRLAKTPAQKRVVDYSIDAQLLRKLLRNQMTPDDWVDYGVRRTAIRTLPQELLSAPRPSSAQDDEKLETFLKPFEAFCAIAVDRNNAMATRLIDKMRQSQMKKAILVAGGFHTAGLTTYFRSQDISYVVLTPNVEHLDPHQNYVDVFARDPLPLEQVFAGDPLFLLSERGLADNSPYWIPSLLLTGLSGTLWQFTQTNKHPDKKALQASLNRWVKMIGPRLQSLRPRLEKSAPGGISLSFEWVNSRRSLGISSTGNISVPPGNGNMFDVSLKFFRDLFRPSPPPIVYSEGLRLKKGGPSKIGETTLSMENLSSVKAQIKKDAVAFDVGERKFWIAQSLIDSFSTFGFENQAAFQSHLTKILTDHTEQNPTAQAEIVIAFLDESSHMFEDHQGNGFVGINKQVLEMNSPDLQRALLFTGLCHELAHENQPPLAGRPLAAFEEAQQRRDADYLWKFLGNRTLTEGERESLARHILAGGTFKIHSAFVNSKGSRSAIANDKSVFFQPVNQDPTLPFWDPETQIPIRDAPGEEFRNMFVGSQRVANRINGLIRKQDTGKQREVVLTKPMTNGETLSIPISIVYLHERTTKPTYVFNRSDIDLFATMFSLSFKKDLPAEIPKENEVVVSIPSLTRLGLPAWKAQNLASFLNSGFDSLSDANRIFELGGISLTPTLRTVAGTARWVLPREQMTQLLTSHFVKNGDYAKSNGELGAAGLWGSSNLLRIVLLEQILLSLLALIGMVQFGIALPGQSVWEVTKGMILVIGIPLFLTLLIIHFFTGVLQPDGSIKKLSLSEEEEDPIKKIMDHLGVSIRASATASRGFLMLPFFALAMYLGMPFLPFFIVVGFLLGTWAHYSSNRKKMRQWRSTLLMGDLTKIPMVQPTSVIYEKGIPIKSSLPGSGEGRVQIFEVIKLPPKNRLEFKVFLENISLILSRDKFNSFGLYSKHLTPQHGEEIEILLEKATGDDFRLVMARWALAELMLAVGLNRGGLWLNGVQREAYAMEYHLKTNYFGYGDASSLVMSDSLKKTEDGKNFARLIRATQMAAILRAAGSSIIDPLNTEGDLEKNQTRDIEMLLAAWGILGNIHKTKIEEIYNLTLRTAFKIPPATPPAKDEIEFLKIKLVHQLDSSFPTHFDPSPDNSFFKKALLVPVLEKLKAQILRAQRRGLPSTQKKPMEPIPPIRKISPQIKKLKALHTHA